MKCLEAEEHRGHVENRGKRAMPPDRLSSPFLTMNPPRQTTGSTQDLDQAPPTEDGMHESSMLHLLPIDDHNDGDQEPFGLLDGMVSGGDSVFGSHGTDGWSSVANLNDAIASLQQHCKWQLNSIATNCWFTNSDGVVFKDFGGSGETVVGNSDRCPRPSNLEQPASEQWGPEGSGITGRPNLSPVIESQTAGLGAFSNVGQTWVWEDFLTEVQDQPEAALAGHV